jgi:hypothetical protein
VRKPIVQWGLKQKPRPVHPAGPSPKKRKPPTHREHPVQAAIVKYHDTCVSIADAELFAIPNGEERNPTVAERLKAEGVRSGVTDMALLLPRGVVVWIETKVDQLRNALGKVVQERTYLEPNQRDFRDRLLAKGHHHRVVRSIEDYVAVLAEFGVPTTGHLMGVTKAVIVMRQA